jgi:type IV fimbrial biogenesis protein FimT
MLARKLDDYALPVRMERGFTLVELMVAVAVAAIVAAFAAPSLRTFMQHNRVAAQSNSVMADLQFARGQAVSTHSYVSVCPLAAAGGTTCDTADGNYDQGWIVFATTAPGAAYDGVASDLLRVEVAPSTTSVTTTPTKGILTYDAFGQLWASGLVAPVAFSICAASNGTGTSTSAVPGVQLNVSSSGRVATSSMLAGASCG